MKYSAKYFLEFLLKKEHSDSIFVSVLKDLLSDTKKKDGFLALQKLHDSDATNSEATALLSLCFFYGIGTDQDLKKAFELSSIAITHKSGNSIGQYILGLSYMNGDVVETNNKKAVEHLEIAAIDNPLAQNTLAHYYFKGEVVEKNVDRAMRLYESAAEQGYGATQFNLGLHYAEANGVKQDHKKAAEYFESAANNGFVLAHAKLGTYYYQGIGVEQDYKKAVDCFTSLAEAQTQVLSGFSNDTLIQEMQAISQCYLGLCYYLGQGVEEDFQKAVAWFETAAKRGNEVAYYMLGEHYKDEDQQKAAGLYFQAARLGDKDSQIELVKLGVGPDCSR